MNGNIDYPKNLAEDNLINFLHQVQDNLGYIPKEVIMEISKRYNIALSKVYSVVTFYNDFKLYSRGKYLVRTCLGTACSVNNNDSNLNYLKKILGIDVNQTTPDGLFTLETVNCVGACSLAPVIQINDKIYGNMTTEKIKNLIEKLKNEAK